MEDLRYDLSQLATVATAITGLGSAASTALSLTLRAIEELDAPWGGDAAGQAFAKNYLPQASVAMFNTMERPHQLEAFGTFFSDAVKDWTSHAETAIEGSHGIEEGL